MFGTERKRETHDYKVRIEFETGNAAFADPEEVGRIMNWLAGRISMYPDSGSIRDINGNTVGTWEVR